MARIHNYKWLVSNSNAIASVLITTSKKTHICHAAHCVKADSLVAKACMHYSLPLLLVHVPSSSLGIVYFALLNK